MQIEVTEQIFIPGTNSGENGEIIRAGAIGEWDQKIQVVWFKREDVDGARISPKSSGLSRVVYEDSFLQSDAADRKFKLLKPEELDRSVYHSDLKRRHHAVTQVLKHFRWNHLAVDLQAVSYHVYGLAYTMADSLPEGAELTVGLRKLLEAHDCFMRCQMPEGK